ncbi:piggyBac transposable element-derived protein 3-like [Salarias fasciatus]|uniref:piggyBac transposable element-derived protein 3-like n=1 Tax=Salarias fasciatus TaxID=181472 RepID=UPI0011766950|nr:piggyBac transposable element-derived protein 3-like [Salarias fasciatus]
MGHLSAQYFYGKRRLSVPQTVVVPAHPAISEDEESDSGDNDIEDPDFIPPSHDLDTSDLSDSGPSGKRRCVRPTVEVLEDEDDEDDLHDHNSNRHEDDDQPAPQAKRPTQEKKSTARLTTWKMVDLNNPPLPEYQHSPPDFVGTPFEYFSRYFSPEVIKHITYQTNLYATQKDVNTTFTTTEDEMLNFLAILIYMGIAELPSIDDYWAMDTRVPQVANLMSSKRFRLMRRLVHFNDNTQIPGTVDRFFKIRPLFSFLNTVFRKEPQTPKQSVDEVMVAYKGKTAGNLRQYIKNKPDKWGFKLFARASEDGFIHDMVLTISLSTTTAIFADNFFTSLELVRYLKDKNCRYTGTARDNRIGKPPLKSIKEMEKKAVPRGTYSYVTSDDGILALRWKDNKTVTLLSTDIGVEPMSSVHRYCSETKQKEEVSCPAVIKSYNSSMGGIDKSDMLVHLYRSPMKSKRWYMRLFAYAIDVSLTNAWVIYKRDCKALGVDGLSLKNFRIQVFRSASTRRPVMSRPRRSSAFQASLSTSVDVPKPVKGHRSHTPDHLVRFDLSLFHAPLHTTRQTCKHCSKKGHILRSNILCRVCKVHLCLNADRNCFIKYHEAVA